MGRPQRRLGTSSDLLPVWLAILLVKETGRMTSSCSTEVTGDLLRGQGQMLIRDFMAWFSEKESNRK